MSRRTLRATIALGAAGALLAACSAESVVERAVGMIDGVEGVDLDLEDGSISIEGEDGALFQMDIDEDDQSATITTEEGTFTTGAAQEYPAELAAVFTPPPGFEAVMVSEFTDSDQRGVMVQGEVKGGFEALRTDLQTQLEGGDWDEVSEGSMAPGVMSVLVAYREVQGGTAALTVSLIMEDESDTGVLSLTYFVPNTD